MKHESARFHGKNQVVNEARGRGNWPQAARVLRRSVASLGGCGRRGISWRDPGRWSLGYGHSSVWEARCYPTVWVTSLNIASCSSPAPPPTHTHQHFPRIWMRPRGCFWFQRNINVLFLYSRHAWNAPCSPASFLPSSPPRQIK